MKEFDEYLRAKEPGRREKAYAWKTAIGLQKVDGLTPSDYLIETAKRNIEGEKERVFDYGGLSPQETVSHLVRFIGDV